MSAIVRLPQAIIGLQYTSAKANAVPCTLYIATQAHACWLEQLRFIPEWTALIGAVMSNCLITVHAHAYNALI
jgi:hypothetical protein